MPEVSVSIDVAVPVERLWSAVVDWPGQAGWIPLTTVEVTRGRGVAVGDRIAARTAVGAVGFVDTMEITTWSPPHRCVVRHLGRVVRGEGEFVVEPLQDGRSRFTWVERLEAPFGRVGTALLRAAAPFSRAVLGLALRRLARRVQA